MDVDDEYVYRAPNFWPVSIVAKWLYGSSQDATWYDSRPRPGNIASDVDPDPPQGAQPANFRPMSVVVKRLDGSIIKMPVPLGSWFEGRYRPRPHCVTLEPCFPLPKGAQPPFSANVYCGQTVGDAHTASMGVADRLAT